MSCATAAPLGRRQSKSAAMLRTPRDFRAHNTRRKSPYCYWTSCISRDKLTPETYESRLERETTQAEGFGTSRLRALVELTRSKLIEEPRTHHNKSSTRRSTAHRTATKRLAACSRPVEILQHPEVLRCGSQTHFVVFFFKNSRQKNS